jgi:hypothetical protein
MIWQPHSWTLGLAFIEGDILFRGVTAPSGPRPPRCRGFTITLRHTALGRTPLDKWWARRRDRYLHNTHKRQTSMPPAGFEAAIPASERPQIHALDRAATGTGTVDGDANMNNSGGRKRIWFWSLRLTVDENWHPRKMSVGPDHVNFFTRRHVRRRNHY